MQEVKEVLDRIEKKLDVLTALLTEELKATRADLEAALRRNQTLYEQLGELSGDALEKVIRGCTTSKPGNPEQVVISDSSVADTSAATKINKGPAHNVSLHMFSPIDIVLIREVTTELGFTPTTAIFGNGVDDMAAIMEPGVAAFSHPDGPTILFERIDPMWAERQAEYTKKGWVAHGCKAVRSYGSILEYQASPG